MHNKWFIFVYRFIQVDDPATVRHGDELQLSMMANVDALVNICF